MPDDSLFARHYIDYVYVPGVLLIIGTAIVKASWVIYAIPVALLFGAYNFWNFRKLPPQTTVPSIGAAQPLQGLRGCGLRRWCCRLAGPLCPSATLTD